MAGSWVAGADGSGFDIDNLPYGAFSRGESEATRLGVRIGGHVLDLRPLAHRGHLPVELAATNLNPFLAAGRQMWDEVHAQIRGLLSDSAHRDNVAPLLLDLADVSLRMPFEVADYVDFYSSEHHAVNLGRMFRPDSEPLLPNWKHIPIGYHGRSGTVVESGTAIVRPEGQRRGAAGPTFGASQRLDIELEMGTVVGGASTLGQPVPIDQARDHIFGMALVNDWSARDIQAWEYQPLGPFLGKSFATSIAPWIVPIQSLEAARVASPVQDPPVFEYLQSSEDWAFDIDLEVLLSTAAMRENGDESVVISQTNFADMYWTPAQQLAHLTVNGATVRPGDLFASGTISGPDPGTYGSLIELTANGSEPIELPGGEARTFLEDGDEITLRGRAGSISFGDVVGQIVS